MGALLTGQWPLPGPRTALSSLDQVTSLDLVLTGEEQVLTVEEQVLTVEEQVLTVEDQVLSLTGCVSVSIHYAKKEVHIFSLPR